MNKFGTITIKGQEYDGCYVDDWDIGGQKVISINGFPNENYRDELLKIAQVSKYPLAWRVEEKDNINEVDDNLLKKAITEYNNDIKYFNTHPVSYYIDEGGDLRLIAGGSIRNKLPPNYINDEYPAISRIVLHPDLRGKGHGKKLVKDFAKKATTYFGEAKAVHFGSENPHIFNIADNLKNEDINFVWIGNEKIEFIDGKYTVRDYIWYRDSFKKAFQEESVKLKGTQDPGTSDMIEKYVTDTITFMENGCTQVKVKDLKTQYDDLKKLCTRDIETKDSLTRLYEPIEYVLDAINGFDIDS